MTGKMIHLGSVLLVAVLVVTLAPAARAQALSRCSITAITESTGIVSAKVNESGAAFQFKVTDAKLLAGLNVGQEVYANFTTRQVSLDGKKMCCEITSPPQAPAPVTTPKIAPPPASAPAPVAAPKIASPAASAPAPVSAPPVSAPVANPAPGASAAAPMAVSATGNKGAPTGPNSTIIAMDTNTSVVTAKENTTGKPFQFKLDNAALLDTLKVGQGVYANFGAGQVSLDGLEPSGQITAAPARAVPLSSSNSPGAAPIGSNAGAGKPAIGPVAAAGGLPGHIAISQNSQQWLAQYPGIMCASANPSKPAILLFHGLGLTFESWKQPSTIGVNWDYSHSPGGVNLGSHDSPNAGVYKVGVSGTLDVDSLNWFDYLCQQGFTVATWTQPSGTFTAAYPSAQAALIQFVAVTTSMNPSSPPPIALLGHSRGGLLIHQLLRDPNMVGYIGGVRWVITLHTPHHGSEVAETPQILAQEIAGLFGGIDLPSDVKKDLQNLAQQTLSPLNQLIYQDEKELAPNSQLIQSLLQNDTPVPGVKYYTFGGTSPMAVRLYTWLYTPESAVPQEKGLSVYFNWQANPAEVSPVSPLLNRVPPVMPEITPGQGDILVSDQSARLPYSIHESGQLNHVEVLWNRPLQQKVVSILSAPATKVLPVPVVK